MIKLCFDPGHGLPDPGAVAGNLKEYELTFDIATRTARHLAGDFDIVLTRTGPNGLGQTEQYDLAARCRIANTSGAEFVISFHINAGGGTGPEIYVLPEARPETRQKAEVIYKALVEVFGGGRGIKTANFYILRQTIAPAVLLEIGFIDNPKDAARLADPAFRDQIAQVLADAIRKIYGKEKPKMGVFKDVDPGRWSARSIERVFKAGLMSGYPDGTFQPDRPLSREEMASILDRMLIHLNYASRLMPQVLPAVVLVHRGDALGSGAVIAQKGNTAYIITNRHVVQKPDGTPVKQLTLIKEGQPNFAGETVIIDTKFDLALIKTDHVVNPISLAEVPAALGDPVVVIGAPYGFTESVTAGIVSNVDRGDVFQLDAPINPGNSGGPVINMAGELVGVTVSKLMSPAEGMGFAIKLENVKDFLSRVQDKIV